MNKTVVIVIEVILWVVASFFALCSFVGFFAGFFPGVILSLLTAVLIYGIVLFHKKYYVASPSNTNIKSKTSPAKISQHTTKTISPSKLHKQAIKESNNFLVKTLAQNTVYEIKQLENILDSVSKKGVELTELPKKTQIKIANSYECTQAVYFPLNELIVKDIPIKLQKSETCYAVFPSVSWKEDRTHTVRSTYSGSSVSFRIAKGVSYHISSGNSTPVKQTTLDTIAHGILYLTNKRLVLVGDTSKTIQYGKIIALEDTYIGVKILKETGKPVVLAGLQNKQAAGLLLERLVNLFIESKG